MKVKIDFLPEFMRLAKPLWKKYASFKQDYMLLLDELMKGQETGTLIHHPFINNHQSVINNVTGQWNLSL